MIEKVNIQGYWDNVKRDPYGCRGCDRLHSYTETCTANRPSDCHRVLDMVAKKTESPQKETYPSGVTRNAIPVRWDLIEWDFIKDLAKVMHEGALSHGDSNWKLGMPNAVAHNHMMEHLALYLGGDRSEPHLAKAAFGLMVMHYNERKGLPDDNAGTGEGNDAVVSGECENEWADRPACGIIGCKRHSPKSFYQAEDY